MPLPDFDTLKRVDTPDFDTLRPVTKTGTNPPASPPHDEEADSLVTPDPTPSNRPTVNIKLNPYEESFLKTGLRDPERAGEGAFTAELSQHLTSDVSNLARGITADIAAGFRALGTGAKEASEYSGNIVAALQREPLPIDKVLKDISGEAPATATIGKISQGIAATAPMLALGALPKALQTAALIGFTGKMISDAPEVARGLGDELGKPKDQQDPDRISSLVSEAIQITGFSIAGGFAMGTKMGAKLGTDPVLASKAEAIKPVAPLTAQAVKEVAVTLPKTEVAVPKIPEKPALAITPEVPVADTLSAQFEQIHNRKPTPEELAQLQSGHIELVEPEKGDPSASTIPRDKEKLVTARPQPEGREADRGSDVQQTTSRPSDAPSPPKEEAIASEDEISKAAQLFRSENKASVTLLQRRHRLGYIKASVIVSELEKRGVIGPHRGAEPREVFQTEPPVTGSGKEGETAVAEAKAGAKVTKEVNAVAKIEGKRSAQEVKDDLINELQKKLMAAPREARAGDTVTVDIPGDGQFTIPNSVDSITQVLERARKIKTDPGKPLGVSKAAVKASSKILESQRRSEKTGPAAPEPQASRESESEQRTPVEILNQDQRVKVTAREGATQLRVTDSKGRSSVQSLANINKGDNPFRGSDIVKVEPGTIGKDKKFAPIKGDVAVDPVLPKVTGPKGEVQMAIVPGAQEFFEKDVVPAITEAAQTLKETGSQVKALLSPPSMGERASLAAGIIREHRAELAQKDVRAREDFIKAKKDMDALSPQASLTFIDRVERGLSQPTPELNNLQKQLRTAFDKRVAEVRALPVAKGQPPRLQQVIQDYFPHIWKDPDAALSWYARIFGKRPLRGPASFLKHRTIPTTADGVAAGLEPVSWNPIELSLLKFHEMDRYVMGQKIFQEFKDKGLADFSRSDIPPDGFAKIDDRIANVVEYRPTVKADGSPGAPERIIRGHWYVQEDAARVLNNFLSPGLERFKWYRALRWIGNTMNMAQLGLSGYHFTFTMIDSGTSKLSLGIEQFAQGKISKGTQTMARGLGGTILANQIEYYHKGSKVLREYTKPGSVGGEYSQIVDALMAGGGRTEMPRMFTNSTMENFFKAVRSGNYPGAIVRVPFAAIEAVSYPLMQNIVPRLKLGAFSEMALHEIERLGPAVTRDQYRAAMGKIWDSIDNRMGELVYDNLFWNRTLKDLSFLGVRAVGWNLGTIRELGGGLVDTTKIIGRIHKGDLVMTKRMAYLIALPMTVGLMGALYQKLRTGKGPESLRDYYYPLTGKMLPDGTPERVNFPSYLKDIGSYKRHPLTTIGHKASPWISTTIDMLNNKDFYGSQIRNPDDPLVKQVGEEMRFVANQFTPFSIHGAEKRAGAKESPETMAESFFGVMPIPAEVARTTAQNKLMEYVVSKTPQGAKTPEQEARYELRKESEQLLQHPEDFHKAQQVLKKGVKRGDLTPGQKKYQEGKLDFEKHEMRRGKSKSDAQWLWRFQHLTTEEAQHVYDLASPQEKNLYRPELNRKLRKEHKPTK